MTRRADVESHTTEWYHCSLHGRRSTFISVTTEEADSMAELIADCADIPARVRTAPHDIPLPRSAAAWSVDEVCLAHVHDIDIYP